MFATRHTSRRSLARIHAAIAAGIYGHAYNDGGTGGGGGNPPTDPPKQDPPKQTALSEDDRKSLLAEARKAWEAEAAAKAKKDQDEREAEEAKKRGEFEKLAASEKSKREAAESKLAAAERERKVEKALLGAAGTHEGYPLSVFEKYVLPTLLTSIPADADDAAIDKAVKDAAKQYVDDNPRQPKGSAGAPAGLPRAGSRAVAGARAEARTPRAPSVAASRF